MSDCTSIGLKAAVDIGQACKYVTESCSEYEFVNFMHYRYCVLEANTGWNAFLFIITMFVLVILSFMVLGSVAETYLTPVLTKVSEALRMSEAISGVTLLAFANGAPDILASISAAGEEDGIYIVVGNLFGACLFASTLVIGRCIGVCPKEIQMQPHFWNRDLIFYIITLLMLVTYGCIGKINLVFSCSFFLVYLIYLAVVIFQNYQQKKEDEDNAHDMDKEKQKEELHKQMNKVIKHGNLNETTDAVTDIDARFGGLDEPLAGDQTGEPKPEEDKEKAKEVHHTATRQKGLTLTMAEIKHIYNEEVEKAVEEKPETVGCVEKFLTIIKFPVEFVSMLIIPNVDDEKIDNWYMPIIPFLSCVAFITITKSKLFLSDWTFQFPAAFFWIGFLVAGALASLLFYYLKKREVKARVWVLIPFSLMTSIICLKSAAGIIVDGIAFTSRVFGVNQVLLGATVLAVGNTLADFFANSSLAALGYGVMACTGSLAGQLFNFLIGFGANTLKLTLNKVAFVDQESRQLQVTRLLCGQPLKNLYLDDHRFPSLLPIVPSMLFIRSRVNSSHKL